MSKHTRGPWTVFKVKRPTGIVLGFGPYPGEKWVGRLSEHLDTDLDTDLANANLIAAAPEMLASIQHAARYLRESLLPQTILENAEPEAQMLKDFESVIAKATGGEK